MNQERLVFLIGAPRSGTTLLQRMLSSHPHIHTYPEPNVLTPLYYYLHLHHGTPATADQPMDLENSQGALKDFREALPGGDADYFQALRAYSDVLYHTCLDQTDKSYFLDKTPIYALFTDFIEQLYPDAKFVILTRHPLAIWHSWAQRYFAGDYERALKYRPILQEYVPAMAAFLNRRGDGCVHVRYKDLVRDPRKHVEVILRYLDLPFDEGVIQYGDSSHVVSGYGDHMVVNQQNEPVTDSLAKWAEAIKTDPVKYAVAERIIDGLDRDDLKALGYPKDAIWEPLGGVKPEAVYSPSDDVPVKRRLMFMVRRIVHAMPLAPRFVQYVHRACQFILTRAISAGVGPQIFPEFS